MSEIRREQAGSAAIVTVRDQHLKPAQKHLIPEPLGHSPRLRQGEEYYACRRRHAHPQGDAMLPPPGDLLLEASPCNVFIGPPAWKVRCRQAPVHPFFEVVTRLHNV
jgi:hypothetical protein